MTPQEFLDDWLRGTTCHHQRRSIFWQGDGGFVILKHHGHSEWCGGSTGQAWCRTYYALYDIHGKRPDRTGDPVLWKHEGRWSEKLWGGILTAMCARCDEIERERAA